MMKRNKIVAGSLNASSGRSSLATASSESLVWWEEGGRNWNTDRKDSTITSSGNQAHSSEITINVITLKLLDK